jgi:hypothetical protein
MELSKSYGKNIHKFGFYVCVKAERAMQSNKKRQAYIIEGESQRADLAVSG